MSFEENTTHTPEFYQSEKDYHLDQALFWIKEAQKSLAEFQECLKLASKQIAELDALRDEMKQRGVI
jgi:hypothetical protein